MGSRVKPEERRRYPPLTIHRPRQRMCVWSIIPALSISDRPVQVLLVRRKNDYHKDQYQADKREYIRETRLREAAEEVQRRQRQREEDQLAELERQEREDRAVTAAQREEHLARLRANLQGRQ